LYHKQGNFSPNNMEIIVIFLNMRWTIDLLVQTGIFDLNFPLL
jgi:hypothetical protein